MKSLIVAAGLAILAGAVFLPRDRTDRSPVRIRNKTILFRPEPQDPVIYRAPEDDRSEVLEDEILYLHNPGPEIRAEVEKKFPGHSVTSLIRTESLPDRLSGHWAFMRIDHPTRPCRTCPAFSRPIAAFEIRRVDGEGQLIFLSEEHHIEELFLLARAKEDEETISIAAELVQLLWDPLGGRLGPLPRSDPDPSARRGSYRFRKGTREWRLDLWRSPEGTVQLSSRILRD